MEFYTNIIFARIALILSILLCVIVVTKILSKKTSNHYISKINKVLRKNHKFFGIFLIITGLIHGYFSSYDILSPNMGTLIFVLSIILYVNWIVRKSFKKSWLKIHRLISIVFAISLIIHIIAVGGFVDLINNPSTNTYAQTNTLAKNDTQNETTGESDTLEKNSAQNSNQRYQDGTYIGTADGFGPDLTVELTIESGKISNINIINHNERGSRFYQPPFDIIPEQIIDSQSTDNVDVVSGSTYTSIGLKNAVDDALKQAEN